MTTNDSAKAQKQGANVDATADKDVSNQAKEAVKEAAENPEPSYLTKEDVKAEFEGWASERKVVFDQAQGRAQNMTQEKIKEVQDHARTEIDSIVQDFEEMLDEDTREAFRHKRSQRKAEEQQAEMQEGLELLREFKQAAKTTVPRGTLTQEQLRSLEATINSVAKNLGSIATARDESVWKGWSAQMGYDESVALATKNISGLNAVKPRESTTSSVPPCLLYTSDAADE